MLPVMVMNSSCSRPAWRIIVFAGLFVGPAARATVGMAIATATARHANNTRRPDIGYLRLQASVEKADSVCLPFRQVPRKRRGAPAGSRAPRGQPRDMDTVTAAMPLTRLGRTGLRV